MEARQADVAIVYNGAAVTTQMTPYKGEVTYTDPASGEADTLDIELNDRDRQWITAWLPVKGDTMEATIKVTDWDWAGADRSLPCGFFVLDDFRFHGWPITGSISGVSVPQDNSFRATERSRTWKNVTIPEIGREIAAKAGVTLVWDVEGTPFKIKSVEQSQKSDCDFFAELCKTYGLAMKVYAQKIVVYDREAYKAKDPVAIIRESMIESWELSSSTTGTYTGGEYTYTDPKTEKEIKATVGTGARILKKSGKADDKADAERKITAAVNEANHGAVGLTMTTIGTAFLVATQCVTVVGLGKLSGKYYIDKITHHIGGSGYTQDLELSLVESMTEAVIQDAIERLVAVKVINSPAYWLAHYKDVTYLDGLLLNLAARIKVNLGGSGINTVDAALEVLTAAGVINSPDYWAQKHSTLAYLDTLIIKSANALTAE